MPIVLENTSITGLAVGGLPNGVVNATTVANSAVTSTKYSGQRAIIAVHTRTDTTRVVTNAGQQTFQSWTLTKVSSTSTLHFEVCFPGHGNSNSGQYIGIGIDGSISYAGVFHSDTIQENGTYIRQIRTGISAGARTIDLRFNTATGSDGRTVDVINANSSDDVRNRQQATVWTVFEIEA
jgi:hypothetical protein